MTTVQVAESTRTTVAPGRLQWRWTHHAELLLVSLSVLVLEIGYTRIISYKLFYYFVYLIIGLALLGIGAGGVAVAVSRRLRAAALDVVIFWSLLLGAIGVIVAYVIVAYVQIDTLAVWRYGTAQSTTGLVLLFVMSLCVFGSFFGPGVVVASLFSRRPQQISGLYFADLVGAGIGCAIVTYLVSTVGAPSTIMFAAAVLAATAMWAARHTRRLFVGLGAVVLVVAVTLSAIPGWLPAQRLDTSKADIQPNQTVLASGWGPIFRVDVAPAGPDALSLFHDGILGASILRWNGKPSFLNRYDFPQDPRSIPFSVLGQAPQREAVIGAAGGHEVLTSLYYRAHHVDAVELNPLTVDYVTNLFANYDGHLAQNPAVTYTTGDGRSYIARSNQHYQLIWYPAPDSYAANGALSGAYVLSESYLYTTNALEANLQHLSSSGIFTAQFGEVDDTYDLRTTRFVATARQALAELGVADPKDHILVAISQVHFLGSIPESTIVVKRSSFTASEVRAFEAATKAVPHTTIMYAPGQSVHSNPVNTVVTTPTARLGAFYASYPYNVTPTTDNDPYFWHFARFGSVAANFTHPLSSIDRENAVGERVLLLLLALSVVIASLFLLAPFLFIRKVWIHLPHKATSALFFAAVGFGFIFFEVTLIQMLNLFLGYPTYALTVTLMSLLVFTGLGALLSQRVRNRRRAIPRLVLAIAAICLFYLTALSPITNAFLDWPFSGRVLLTFILLAPLGLCLGMFMPIGLGEIARLSEFPREYVAWGWAVNGFASVVGSVLGTLLAMSYGFDAVLILGVLAYVVALGAWFVLTRGLSSSGSPGAHARLKGGVQ